MADKQCFWDLSVKYMDELVQNPDVLAKM